MLDAIIRFSLRNKLVVLLLTVGLIGSGVYSLMQLPIGAVPDITNNQVQVITTSKNLSTQDVEQYITYPVELEFANLPGVEEIRSVSKFGLSVVTVVFEDDMGTYLPRQLIAEKLATIQEKIPAEFGVPAMGPITTGLGEIYQYTLEIDPKYKNNYTITDLRTIQDWVVKRRLSGIKGVVEVNTWGGYLKQYEVSVDPERLHSMNLSIQDVFAALESNNSTSGGGYIEKTNETYFIRGEGKVTSLEDIEQIVVENRAGTPILMRDIAQVGFGHAIRFGAITGNGEGEKVMGQVMMLKDANSGQVIADVNQRVAELQSKLPEGIRINPFLERSELIGKTTFTITENLVLGCLIVIFVVVLLLGNWRSGLVVASVIPLCLLFALTGMNIFGVDANLMSLGAIDFGIIIDGAVIIVEYVAFQIAANYAVLHGVSKAERQAKMDELTFQGASKMMHSAVFGQLIIMLVFIPILSLSGVEGKMFIPMALVFLFALAGAMLLCFTYVPVISSLFLRAPKKKENFSTRMIASWENVYEKALRKIIRRPKIVLPVAGVLLIFSFTLFSRMGGEFVPTLDEGDFVIQPALKTGTTLSNTVDLTTKMEKILLRFPEVDQVVSRIGAAEIPTDPMSMEESDVIIKLTPKKTWTTAETKDELADHFKAALQEIPGIDYEFTQPIEMRFNELITGVRADLAIKIFGEDLDVLNKKAQEVRKLIQHIPGASDIVVEKVAGLPQMTVRYKRDKVAKYGLNIQLLNQLVAAGFAGTTAGIVNEGEKRFDLVVRFNKDQRNDLEDLMNTFVSLPDGSQIPLSEVAEISYTQGPAKISRDQTHRRIVIGVNVRGRDLESVVSDVQTTLKQKLQLPEGYEVFYGGQFENLRSAKDRLVIAVPIALALIFLFLYFAFQSVKDALMVYSAIPLAAVGGIILLFLRDMPFSISAGVGFIALFGIAVLNGIVLIEHYKELESHGYSDLYERVIQGTKQRLRPVLLTASAAALGFLPMAISSNAGAEVQRPLATVVVGGLITATLLTLFVLPMLYTLFHRSERAKTSLVKPVATLLFLVGASFSTFGQSELAPWIDSTLKNNLELRLADKQLEQAKVLEKTGWNIEKTMLYVNKDMNNLPPVGGALSVVGAQQTLAFPTVYFQQKKWYEAQTELQRITTELQKRQVLFSLYQSYNQLQWQVQQARLIERIDSFYTQLLRKTELAYQAGDINTLQLLQARSLAEDARVRRLASTNAIAVSKQQLRQLSQSSLQFQTEALPFVKYRLSIDSTGVQGQWWDQQIKVHQQALKVQQQGLLPDLHVQYFLGRNNEPNAIVYPGIQGGVSVPLFYGAQRAKIQSVRLEAEMAQQEKAIYERNRQQKRLEIESQQLELSNAMSAYETVGKNVVQETWKTATMSIQNGEISWMEYLRYVEQAIQLEQNYLGQLYRYNQLEIERAFLP